MAELTDLSTKEFLARLASAAPVPGGGGGAALAGALAAALSSMVANLTVGKQKFADRETEIKQLLAAAERAREQLLMLVEEDAAVFSSFMACYALPKAMEAEKLQRTAAIEAAAKRAAQTPLAIARVSVSTAELAARLAEIGNPGVITDAAVGIILARAALRSAVYNVLGNLKLTHDDAFHRQTRSELERLQARALALETAALALVDAQLQP